MASLHGDDGDAIRPAQRRTWLIPTVVIVVVLLLAGGAITALYVANTATENDAAPTPTATTRPTSAAIPTPTPTATPVPTPSGASQPTDCFAIYPQAFLDAQEGEPLNDPSVSGTDISRYRAIEEIRETLPGFECHWGLPTEGGVANAVNTVTAPEQARVITLLEENEHVCAPENDGIVCRQSEGPMEGWTLAEEHFFRDGLWVSTWWAGTQGDIADTSGPIYDTIWG
ncbi:hypothetical protein IWX78_000817 [Mycetocola sp. CAN_C7]|uniref:hypothetical protein n=1 Tax=Mycetocola sp. CAN_C7 TaxID=2787724 RepID=UPI0018CA8283